MSKLDPQAEDALIAHLLQFVTPEKQVRMEEVIAGRTSRIQVVLEDIFQPHNASAVMRSCECFGIQHLHVIENRYPYTLNREVAMGSSNWIFLHRYREEAADNTSLCLGKLRSEGFRIIATTLDPDSVPLQELTLDGPVALWFGTEEHGLSEAVLEQADTCLHIPMRGFTQSFNVSVSAAICLHTLRLKLEESGLRWELTPEEKRDAYRFWLRKSVKNAEIIEKVFLSQIGEETSTDGNFAC